MWQAITQQLSATLTFQFDLVERSKLNAGDIHDCYMISNGNERYFVKVNHRDNLPLYEAEANNLRLLAESQSVLVPQPIVVGVTKNHSFIILDYLPTKPLDDLNNQYRFGQQMAKLHQWGEQKEYGFDEDNYLGEVLQPNPWNKKWHLFFAEQRIGWQLQLLKEKGIFLVNIDEFVDVIKQQLTSHTPKPSLLHGALWFSNVAHSVTGPICYDPACYWGDRECDIAMTELVTGFQDEFYQGYQSLLPLDNKYQQRKEIYNLYHRLNHCNQFGGHYLNQADDTIQRILAF
ncbi:fructosamine kinase family protein [Vibrio metschnikovii]|nr:fructosamine kinase family protein [Vibrio metschnikovii]